jgi:hypothetical protein
MCDFGVLKAVTVKITVFWDMKLCAMIGLKVSEKISVAIFSRIYNLG